MPHSDYTLEFEFADNEKVSYSLWLDPVSESGFIMKNSSYFAQLNNSTAKELMKILEP
jgi:hypothetical protein